MHLELKNYRNYSHVCLDFEDKTVIFTGNNGQGKTNILESIYYLSSGRSHKSINAKRALANWKSDYFLIRAVLEEDRR
jgi:DNA replication and repair protein RecF